MAYFLLRNSASREAATKSDGPNWARRLTSLFCCLRPSASGTKRSRLNGGDPMAATAASSSGGCLPHGDHAGVRRRAALVRYPRRAVWRPRAARPSRRGGPRVHRFPPKHAPPRLPLLRSPPRRPPPAAGGHLPS